MMATANVKLQCRLSPYARGLLYVAAVLARVGLRIPHSWVVAVVNRCWSVRVANGSWQRIRIDANGRRVA
jgi:hypothetical protein